MSDEPRPPKAPGAKHRQRKRQLARLRNELAAAQEAIALRDKALTGLRHKLDRRTAALQAIAQGDVPHVTFADDDLISAFAQEALV